MISPDEESGYSILSDHPGYFARVFSAERYASEMLPFIPRGLPVYQSHGACHSKAIIRYINQFIRTSESDLNPREVFLLYLAAWFHDLGYLHPSSIHDRKSHSELSADMIRTDPFISDLVNVEEFQSLSVIIRFHDTNADLADIENIINDRSPLLAAIFRLTDSVDLGSDRCPPNVFSLIQDILDERSRQHWKAHNNINECNIDYPYIRILVNDPQNKEFKNTIIPHLEDDCRSSGRILKQYGFSPPVPVYLKFSVK